MAWFGTLIRKNMLLIITIIMIAVLMVVPYNTSSFDEPDSVGYIRWYGERIDPVTEYSCLVSMNNTIWAHERNYTVDFHIQASFKVSEVGFRTLNVTRLVLHLFIDSTTYISLLDWNFTPQLMLPNTTSLNEPTLRYEMHIPVNVSLNDKRFIHILRGPKIKANLAFEVYLNSDGNPDKLSNFYNPGHNFWTPVEFPIVIDEPLSRVLLILLFSSLALIPGILYSIGRYIEKKEIDNRLGDFFDQYQNKLYYLGLSCFGVFISIVFALVHGPSIFYTSPIWMYTFSGLVVLIGGFSVSLCVPGFNDGDSTNIDTVVQYSRYSEIIRLIGLRYRTRTELDGSSFTWNPKHEQHSFRMAISRPELLLLLALSWSFLIGNYQSVSSPLLHPLSMVLIGACFYLFMQSSYSKWDISDLYEEWRESYIRYWTVLYVLVVPIESLLDFYKPLETFRVENPSQLSDYESLRNILTPGKTRSIISHQTPDAILTASIVWYYRTYVIQNMDDIDDANFKDVLEDVLSPFEKMRSVWSHQNGPNFLLRRLAFAFNLMALWFYSNDIAIDCSELALNPQISSNLTSQHLVSQIMNHYNEATGLSSILKLKYLRSIMSFRVIWIPVSFLIAFPVSIVIWSFI